MAEPLTPATQAGREYHDSLHEPGGPFEAITGRAECGSIGCGSLSRIIAIERDAARAAAPQGDERCPQVAGRCEKPLGHEGAHYTAFGGDDEPTWRWSLAADVMPGRYDDDGSWQAIRTALATSRDGPEPPEERFVAALRTFGFEVRAASQGDEGPALPSLTSEEWNDAFDAGVVQGRFLATLDAERAASQGDEWLRDLATLRDKVDAALRRVERTHAKRPYLDIAEAQLAAVLALLHEPATPKNERLYRALIEASDAIDAALDAEEERG